MKIVILGGGTAGWIIAMTIAKIQPNAHDITVIESKRLGIIGAGEGSTNLFVSLIAGSFFHTGIDLNDFIEKTNATVKLGIKHVNWTGDGTHYFAPLDGTRTALITPDAEFCKAILKNKNKAHMSTELGHAYERGYIPTDSNPKLLPYALHFDAFKVGEYLSNVAIQAGVKHIDADICDVKTNADKTEVISLTDTNNNEYEADFFIDCSGFSRRICNAMDMGWVDYSKNLPVNAAIAFQKPLDGIVEPVTSAIAMNAGWVWKIPTAQRYGMGYVYSNKFITEQQAIDEVNRKFDDPQILRKFNFTSGRSNLFWKGNCISLGLSSVFLEPLEATSIHTTIMQTLAFVMEHLHSTKERTINQYRINDYNRSIANVHDTLRDFLVLHYKGGRTDTEFWKYMSSNEPNTEKVDYLLDISKDSIVSQLTLQQDSYRLVASMWNWILWGIGKINEDTARSVLRKLN